MKQQTYAFKRKFPRRKFHGYVGVLHRSLYDLCQCAVLGEGGMAFLADREFPNMGLVVVTFKIPGDLLISIRGEIRNVRLHQDTKLFFHGIQFFSLPIEDRRKIRSYVSARTQNEELV
jgi:hypothetical protein